MTFSRILVGWVGGICLLGAGCAVEGDLADGSPEPATSVELAQPEARAARPIRSVLLIPGTLITGDTFDTMAARLRHDGYTPVIFQPPDLFTESLAVGAQRIAAVVDARLRETGEQRLDIVAECNGGVATRYYLERLGGDARVNQVVTFVSAHHGTWESPVAAWFSGFQSLVDITPGSRFLRDLNSASWPAGLHMTSIYTCWDEFMVPYTTSRVDGAVNVRFCSHKIGHFGGFWDAVVYARIVAALEGHGEDAGTEL